ARKPRSLSETLNPRALSPEALQQEVLELQQWLSSRSTTSDPDTERMVTVLNGLENEVRRRSASEAAAKAPKDPLIPSVKGATDKERLINALALLQSIQQVGSGLYTIVLDGETRNLTQKDVDDANRRVRGALRVGLIRSRGKADGAESGYSNQSEVDKKH